VKATACPGQVICFVVSSWNGSRILRAHCTSDTLLSGTFWCFGGRYGRGVGLSTCDCRTTCLDRIRVVLWGFAFLDTWSIGSLRSWNRRVMVLLSLVGWKSATVHREGWRLSRFGVKKVLFRKVSRTANLTHTCAEAYRNRLWGLKKKAHRSKWSLCKHDRLCSKLGSEEKYHVFFMRTATCAYLLPAMSTISGYSAVPLSTDVGLRAWSGAVQTLCFRPWPFVGNEKNDRWLKIVEQDFYRLGDIDSYS